MSPFGDWLADRCPWCGHMRWLGTCQTCADEEAGE